MATTEQTSRVFSPDWVVSPGEILADHMEELGLTRAELATRLGRSEREVLDLLDGRLAITPGLAQELALVTGTPSATWSGLQAIYDERSHKGDVAVEPDQEG